MVEDIFKGERQELERLLEEITWMDETTRAEALKKAKSLVDHIGYPEKVFEDESLKALYGGVELEPDDAFENQLRLINFYLNSRYRKFRLPVSKLGKLSSFDAASANAYYWRQQNSIREFLSNSASTLNWF